MRTNAAGTTSSSFQFDSANSGPRVRNVSGILEVRNAADNDEAGVKCDAITLTSALSASSIVPTTNTASLDQTAVLSVVDTTVWTTAAYPALSTFDQVDVQVTAAYDPGTTMQLGHSIDNDALLEIGDVDLALTGVVQSVPIKATWDASPRFLRCTLAGGPPGVGAMTIWAHYSTPRV